MTFFEDEVEETGLVSGLLDDILPDIKESLTWGMRFTDEISPFLKDSMFDNIFSALSWRS